MQLGSQLRSLRRSIQAASVSVFALSGACTASGEFQAFTWARNHPASTDHVTGMIQVDPWCNLEDVARRLKALPEGKRFIVFSWMTDDMCDNPADRCIERVWETRTRWVLAPAPPAPPKAAALAKSSGPSVASAGRSPGSATTAAAKQTPAAPSPVNSSSTSRSAALVAVKERVQVDRPTSFRGPWIDRGVQTVRARVSAAMQRLRQLGASVDGVAVDNETTLHAAHFVQTEGSFAAIQSDPRWPALAKSMGLPAELNGINWGTDLYFRWSERMAGRFDTAMNYAVFHPIRAAFPNAAVSNYCANRMTAAFASPDLNGHLERRITPGFGTHDNHEFYGWSAPAKIARFGGTDPVTQSWISFRAEVHRIRGMNASSTRAKSAWIAARSWPGEWWGPIAYAGTSTWDELVLQLGMHGVRQFLEFSPELAGVSAADNLVQRTADRATLEALLAELDKKVGGAGAGFLTSQQPSWNDRVIATGRVVVDRVVWRFSFAEGVKGVTVTMDDGTQVYLSPDEDRRGTWFSHSTARSLRTEASGARLVMALDLEEAP
jgi:hypothetical protein